MDISTSSEPSSMLHVRASTMYPLGSGSSLEPGENLNPLPFPLLCGEARLYFGHCVDGSLALTNYRLFINSGGRHVHIPLGLVDSVEVRDLFYLHVSCKDARSYRCTFNNNDACTEWFRRLTNATAPPRQLQDLFAFCFYAWANERENEDIMQRLSGGDEIQTDDLAFRSEVERLGFDLHGAWRISRVNSNYRLCSSYPPLLLVPACVSDDTLEAVARFRSARRVPAVVWRHSANGAVIARCSQPEVGWLGWRSAEDEDLLQAIADACAFDRGPRSLGDRNNLNTTCTPPHSPTVSDDSELVLGADHQTDGITNQTKKVLIMDARSYTTAVANRARGGGCECPEYYPSCDIQFMNLANIHSVRKSFLALRALCGAPADQAGWWSGLEGTRWLNHMSGLLRAAAALVAAVERDARPALVHCSDGWDRTPQIVALAQLLLDPHYRTIRGFRVLVEREWLAFGHKFADRCGHAAADDPNERCPVFLQWLDCVHQLHTQFPTAFQFTGAYLVKLAQHVYSRLFGTFLCNTKQERVNHVVGRTFSVWRYLDDIQFINRLYAPPTTTNRVLWPACNVRDLKLWSDVYIGSLESTYCPIISKPQTNTAENTDNQVVPATIGHSSSSTTSMSTSSTNTVTTMTKTRSYTDLPVSLGASVAVRRCSDPNITLDQLYEKLMVLSQSKVSSRDELSPVETPPRLNGYQTCENHWLHKDINHNGAMLRCGDDDSDDADRSEVTLCTAVVPIPTSSTDTSTDTLVPENGLTSEDADTTERSELLQNGASDGCEVCAQNRKLIGDKHLHQSSSTSGKTSRYSTPPTYSRASSGCGGGGGGNSTDGSYRLDVDGLALLQSDIQHRLRQLHDEFRAREEALQRELHTTRMALIKQVCHNCSHHDIDKPDDTSSLVGSVSSAGEREASAGDSLPSDLSWEALDDGTSPETIAQRTLWVPDHAVSRCTGCRTEFWLGRRKHHCRSCGRIFCADCSENSAPLPNEQLFNPVRVCTPCYAALRRSCQQHAPPPLTQHPLAASSN